MGLELVTFSEFRVPFPRCPLNFWESRKTIFYRCCQPDHAQARYVVVVVDNNGPTLKLDLKVKFFSSSVCYQQKNWKPISDGEVNLLALRRNCSAIMVSCSDGMKETDTLLLMVDTVMALVVRWIEMS